MGHTVNNIYNYLAKMSKSKDNFWSFLKRIAFDLFYTFAHVKQCHCYLLNSQSCLEEQTHE